MARTLKSAAPAAEVDETVRSRVSEMLSRIEREGDDAIRHYSSELDGWNPSSFLVDARDVAAAEQQVPQELREHVEFAAEQIRSFAMEQRATLQDLETTPLPGVTLGHRHIPVSSVGSYAPGGRYPLIASVLMTVVVPKVAGVGRVVACAPPWKKEGIHPFMLYAMAVAGADEVLAIGGVQALAAMAFGLVGIEPVDMIVGAGNAYVAEAKRQLFGTVGIDLLAGPTEIVIIADDGADAELVAADLLGQAEHGPTSPAAAIVLSDDFGARVLAEVERLLSTWPTAEVAGQAWRDHGSVVVVDSYAEAASVSDRLAPEHLELHVADDASAELARTLTNYGSLFVGADTTVAYGDKAVGTNHVLPTRRAARFTGGLWVGKFLKTCTYQRLTPAGSAAIAPAVAAISMAESMEGHALTATMRLDRLARAGEATG